MHFYQEPALQAFNQLNNRIEELYHKIAAQLHLSDSAFLILYSIVSLGAECTQKEICDFIFLNKQTVNSSVLKLQKDGYLCLRAGTGREMRIVLTERGEKLLREKILPVIEAENKVFQSFSPAECEALISTTEKYLHVLHRNVQFLFEEPTTT